MMMQLDGGYVMDFNGDRLIEFIENLLKDASRKNALTETQDIG